MWVLRPTLHSRTTKMLNWAQIPIPFFKEHRRWYWIAVWPSHRAKKQSLVPPPFITTQDNNPLGCTSYNSTGRTTITMVRHQCGFHQHPRGTEVRKCVRERIGLRSD